MTRLDSAGFAENLVNAVNNNSSFAQEAEWFDGSVLIEDGPGKLWLKIYRGKIIDHLPFVPPIGYTFKIAGPSAAWDELASGKKFTDLILGGTRRFDGIESVVDGVGSLPGPIALEGNLMEAHRIVEAIYLIAEGYAATARAQGASV
jgi:hypothetical protein